MLRQGEVSSAPCVKRQEKAPLHTSVSKIVYRQALQETVDDPRSVGAGVGPSEKRDRSPSSGLEAEKSAALDGLAQLNSAFCCWIITPSAGKAKDHRRESVVHGRN